MLGPITYLDAGLIAVCFISGLLAMYRGFTREMLSIVSWAVAGAAVLYFVYFHKPFAQEMAQQMGTKVTVAQIVVGAIIFLIVLIVVHLITARISDAMLDSRVGMIDRILGFLFGVARGVILVVIPYMFAVYFLCKDSSTMDVAARCQAGDLPIWVERAQSLPAIQSVSNFLYIFVETHFPASLTAPSSAPAHEEQQGSLKNPWGDELALEARGKYHICVTWQVPAA